MKPSLLLFGCACLSGVRAEPTYPLLLNNGDHFACNSEARAMDSNEKTTDTNLLIAGITHSASQVAGTSVGRCTANPVPFVASFQDSTLLGYRTFSSYVHFEKDGTQGVFTDVATAKMTERHDWNKDSVITHSVLVLKF